jgi:branched-chain amino acid transport system ATP-binding protein
VPLVRAENWRCPGTLETAGQAILVLVIDKNVDLLTRIADRHHGIEKGGVVWTGSPAAPGAAAEVQLGHRGVARVGGTP